MAAAAAAAAAAATAPAGPAVGWSAFHGFAVAWSPWGDGALAVGTGQYYGLAGNGGVEVFDGVNGSAVAGGGWREARAMRRWVCSGGTYAVAWSEAAPGLVVSGGANGVVALWDVGSSARDGLPIARWAGRHAGEVGGVACDPHVRTRLASGGWDGRLVVHDTGGGAPVSLASYTTPGSGRVYAVAWHPSNPHMLASNAGAAVCVWDVRAGAGTGPASVFPASRADVLALDWGKYAPWEVATGGADGAVRLWDTRAPRYALADLPGHLLPVSAVRYSPWEAGVLASASYDMSVRLWDGARGGTPVCTARYTHHREFVRGLDWDLAHRGVLASVGWDQAVAVWHTTAAAPPPPLPPLPPAFRPPPLPPAPPLLPRPIVPSIGS